jgi:hypothetical protein
VNCDRTKKTRPRNPNTIIYSSGIRPMGHGTIKKVSDAKKHYFVRTLFEKK